MTLVLLAGGSGFVGRALRTHLADNSVAVRSLVRREPTQPHQVRWNPAEGTLPDGCFEGVDAVINLAGASIGRIPWTRARRRQMLYSRVDATHTLADAIVALDRPPVLVNGSAVGWYGSRGEESLDEDAGRGDGVLADIAGAWESAARIAAPATRVVSARTGLVLGPGGALAPIVATTRLGLGARIGDGRAWWPWISLRDEAAALAHLALHSRLDGPVNLVAPTPARSEEITRAIAEHFHRPHRLTIPARLVEALGAAGRELLLASQRVDSMRLVRDGFVFRDESVVPAIADAFPHDEESTPEK